MYVDDIILDVQRGLVGFKNSLCFQISYSVFFSFTYFFFELQVKPMVIKNPHTATLHHHPHLPHTGTATLHPRTASQPMEVMLPMINNYFSLLTWFIVIAYRGYSEPPPPQPHGMFLYSFIWFKYGIDFVETPWGFSFGRLIIRELKSHMIPYKFKCSDWWKINLQSECCNSNQWEHLNL